MGEPVKLVVIFKAKSIEQVSEYISEASVIRLIFKF